MDGVLWDRLVWSKAIEQAQFVTNSVHMQAMDVSPIMPPFLFLIHLCRTAVLGTKMGDAALVDCRSRNPKQALKLMDLHNRKINTIRMHPSDEQVSVLMPVSQVEE